jgi:hypothetical protein
MEWSCNNVWQKISAQYASPVKTYNSTATIQNLDLHFSVVIVTDEPNHVEVQVMVKCAVNTHSVW